MHVDSIQSHTCHTAHLEVREQLLGLQRSNSGHLTCSENTFTCLDIFPALLIFLLKNHKALLKIIKEYTDEKLPRILIMNTSCIQLAAPLKIFS